MTADGSLDDRITPEGVVGPYNFMDGDTSSDEDPDDNNGDSGAGGDLSPTIEAPTTVMAS